KEKIDLDDLKEAKDKLQEKAMALATRVYEEAAKANNTEEVKEEKEDKKSKKDDAEEADYEEK
ncbi:MAG: hypothetical protein ILA19_05270, partial [Bacilli bacterium]|nr:hypothetical protein [Bacilli bacterium]